MLNSCKGSLERMIFSSRLHAIIKAWKVCVSLRISILEALHSIGITYGIRNPMPTPSLQSLKCCTINWPKLLLPQRGRRSIHPTRPGELLVEVLFNLDLQHGY